MNRGELVVASDADALADLVAEHVLQTLGAALAERGTASVALAGGSTPQATYERLASPELRRHIDWSRIEVYFGDERCVAPDDAESNYRMARTTLLEPLAIAPERIARMRGEDAPAVAAAAYAALLRERLGAAPRFDLVMLGVGSDGHTASLFPGEDPLTDDAALVRAPLVAKLGTHRITLTPAVINGARTIAIATAGEGKAEAVARAREGAYDPIATPVQIVAPPSGRLLWLIDTAAARLLTQPG